jgi:hypothetical protein
MMALDFILLACGTWYVSYVLTRLDGPMKIFLWLRDKRIGWGVTRCIFCTSFWVAIGLYALLYYEITEPVHVVGAVGASHFFASYSGVNYVHTEE